MRPTSLVRAALVLLPFFGVAVLIAGPASAWDRGQTRDLRGGAQPGGQRAGRYRRADRRPGRHGLYALFRRQRQGSGRRAAASVLVQARRPPAQRRRPGQSGPDPRPAAQRHLAGAGVSAVVEEPADLRPRARDRLAGRSGYRQVERVHEYRAGRRLRPQRHHFRQGRERLCIGLVSGRDLEDRPRRRSRDGLRQFPDLVAAGGLGGDPGAAVRGQRRRVQQRILGNVCGEHRLSLDRRGADDLKS